MYRELVNKNDFNINNLMEGLNMKKNNNEIKNKKTKVMTLLLVLIFAFALCGCKKDATKGERPDVIIDDEATPAPTEAPVEEATPAPTEVPVEEATPAPTEEPSVVYEGIDMNSTLSGQEWLETFIGVIDEPKVVVFSDVTGKKVIVEQEGEVIVNLEEDSMALFFPKGYTNGNVSSGVSTGDTAIETDNYYIFTLDAEKMKDVEEREAAFLVMKGDERVPLIVYLKIE